MLTLNTLDFKEDSSYPGYKVSDTFSVPDSYLVSDGIILGTPDSFNIAVPLSKTGAVNTSFVIKGLDRYYPKVSNIGWDNYVPCSDWGNYRIEFDSISGTLGYDGEYYIDPVEGVAAASGWVNHTERGFSTGSTFFEWTGFCKLKIDCSSIDLFQVNVYYPKDSTPISSSVFVGGQIETQLDIPKLGKIEISGSTNNTYYYQLESDLGAGLFEIDTEYAHISRLPNISGTVQEIGNIGCDFKINISSSKRIYPYVKLRRITAALAFESPTETIMTWPYDSLVFTGDVKTANKLGDFIRYSDTPGNIYYKFTAITGTPLAAKSHNSKINMPYWVSSDDLNSAGTLPIPQFNIPDISMWKTTANVPTGECLVDLGYSEILLKEYPEYSLYKCPQPGYTFINNVAYFINLDTIVYRGKGTGYSSFGVAEAGEPLNGDWYKFSIIDKLCDTYIHSRGLANLINRCSISGNQFIEVKSNSSKKELLDLLEVSYLTTDNLGDRGNAYYLSELSDKISSSLFNTSKTVNPTLGNILLSKVPKYRYFHEYVTPVNGICTIPFKPDFIEIYYNGVKQNITLSGTSFASNKTVEVHMFGKNYMVDPGCNLVGPAGLRYLGYVYELPKIRSRIENIQIKSDWTKYIKSGLYLSEMDTLSE